MERTGNDVALRLECAQVRPLVRAVAPTAKPLPPVGRLEVSQPPGVPTRVVGPLGLTLHPAHLEPRVVLDHPLRARIHGRQAHSPGNYVHARYDGREGPGRPHRASQHLAARVIEEPEIHVVVLIVGRYEVRVLMLRPYHRPPPRPRVRVRPLRLHAGHVVELPDLIVGRRRLQLLLHTTFFSLIAS